MQKLILYSLSFFTVLQVSGQTNIPDGSVRPGATAVAVPGAYGSAIPVNYVRTREAVGPISNVSTFNAAGTNQVREATQYIDGLGRPLQTVLKQGSPLLKDVVSPVLYDAFGREQYKYLPYTSGGGDGTFKMNPFAEQATFMDSQYSGESIYYSETRYEASPLNRVSKTLAPGNSWGGSNRGIGMEYRINDANDGVRAWTITNNALTYSNEDVSTNIPTSSTTYAAGTLYETHTIDEHDKRVVEYKDKEGRVVLKKVQTDNSPSESHGGWLCTYYVYDDFGLLRYVIQPKAVEQMNGAGSWQLGTDQVNELSFRYEYDGRNRMIAKKVPGAGWVYMVYDKRDRLAYSQDANMRSRNQWLATLYDGLNRPVATGMISYSGTRADLQSVLDANFDAAQGTVVSVNFSAPGILYVNQREAGRPAYRATTEIQFTDGFTTENGAETETFIGAATTSTSTVLQNYNPFPSGANFIGLTITNYDDYSQTTRGYTTANNTSVTDGGNAYPEPLPSTASVLTRGLVTSTKVRILEDPNDLSRGDWLETVNFYDDKGRVIQTQSDNYKSGTEITTLRYDFTGKLITSYQVHNNPAASQTVKVRTNMLYDQAGRLLQVSKTLNDDGATTRLLARNEYDELGQLKNKKLGQKSGTDNTEMELQAYEYNIRNWLKGINKGYANNGGAGTWFGMELNYDWGFEKNQYNGNVSGSQWRSRGDDRQRAYGYGYDGANRLLFGDFNQYNSGWNKGAGLDFSVTMGDGLNYASAYDGNGNIKAMKQMGWKPGGSSAVDELVYNYTGNSNKLLNVIDGVNDPLTKLGDFRASQTYLTNIGSKTSSTQDYSYDVNGNLLQDKNKDISGIVYNHLNLPWQVTVTGKGTITYIYDATGNKLEKRTAESSPQSRTTKTAYIGGYVYQNDSLQFLAHEEGRIRKKMDGSYVYDYFIKDHLGNTRAVLTEEQQTDQYPVASLEDGSLAAEKNYYTIPDDAGTRVNRNTVTGYPTNDTYTNPNDYIHKLNGNGTKVGSSMVLKVMSGDKVTIRANSWYRLNGANPANSVSPVTDLVAALAGQVSGASGAKLLASQLNGTVLSPSINDFLNNRNTNNYDNAKPKAYVSYVLLDEQLKPVLTGDGKNSGFSQVGADQDFTTHFVGDREMTRSGYLYIYVSNESVDVNVYFDNLQVTHTRGPLLEETHYYPFGLTMAGISSKAAGKLENRKQYNGIEHTTDLGLNQYDAFFRNLDPQIGRFWQVDPETDNQEDVSPYESMGNNPITNVDPLGDFKTRFGAWWHSLWHGGKVGKNNEGEYFVSKPIKTTNSEDGTVTVGVSVTYGKGRHALSAAAERMQEESNNQAYEDKMVRLGTWQRHETVAQANEATFKNSVGMLLPNIIKGGTALVNTRNATRGSLSFRNGVIENFIKHAFANGRHADLGMSVESMVTKTQELITQNMSALRAGDNTIIANVNGIQKSFKAFVKDGEIMSVNMYPGVSNRATTGTVINVGNITW